MNPEPNPNDLLRRLAVGTWGACMGVLLATVTVAILVAVNGDTQDREHAGLLPSESIKSFILVPWQERYERIWYALVCVCGALGGLAAARLVRPSPWLAAASAIAFIPIAQPVCAAAFSTTPDVGLLLLCGAILAVPVVYGRTRSVSDGVPPIVPHPVADAPGSPSPVATLALALTLLALLYGTLAPHDVTAAASECYTESHVASYLIGPSLYYRAPGAVPGLDFESHYGIGHAYAFSLVMGSHGFERTMERYVWFVVVVTGLYLLSGFLVLTDWLRNPWAAFGVSLLLLGAVLEGVSYRYPSNWPVRHPFAFAFLFCAVRGTSCSRSEAARQTKRGVNRVNCVRWCLAAGAVAGLSLFWQTDVGLYTLAAGVALYLANAIFVGGSARMPAVFVVATGGTFFAMCLVLFGPRVLSPLFCERLLEPLLLYGTGFGNQLLNWQSAWGYWYNLIGPVLAVASVGVLIGYRREEVPPRAAAYAAVASLLGLAMLFKWVNRSIDVVWSLNGGLVVAVAGCWAWLGWRAVCEQLRSDTRPLIGTVRQVAAAGVLLVLAVVAVREDSAAATDDYQGGSSSPLVRVAVRLDTFANPINAVRKGTTTPPAPLPLDTDTLTYLRANTSKTERVAVISPHEWGYLAAAGRAPRLSWVQLFLVHSPVLLDRCADDLQRSDRVFVQRDALGSLETVNPVTHARVARILDEQFGPPEWTPCRWLVYRRKPGPTAQR